MIMSIKDENFVKNIFNHWNFTNLVASADTYYNLLWYINMGENPFASGLFPNEIRYISGLNIRDLIRILGPMYRGPRDHASLLFAIISGKSTPHPNADTIPRYIEIIKYSPAVIWNFFFNVYGLNKKRTDYIPDMEDRLGIYPPYVRVSNKEESLVDRILLGVNENNVDNFMNLYQVAIPTRDPPRNQKEKLDYFTEEILRYELILTRPQTTILPPILTHDMVNDVDDVYNNLSVYTSKELIEAYEPLMEWNGYYDLIRIIILEKEETARWAWRHRWCNNDDTMNVLEGELHGNMNKYDINNPTVSYGTQRNYRCYQINELENSFREIDGVFHFYIPDWRPGDNDREFSIETIRELRTLIRSAPRIPLINAILRKIAIGIRWYKNTEMTTRRLKTIYDSMTAEQQHIVRLYLAWLFMYGMWMHFWRGPGHPWPTEQIELLNVRRGHILRCNSEDRDEHIFIQQSIRTVFVETYEKDPVLRGWIDSMPSINYSFKTGKIIILERLNDLLDKFMMGKACMGIGSSIIIGTAYYFINSILAPVSFDDFIMEMMPRVLEIERQVVAYQLAHLQNLNNKDAQTRVRILLERQLALVQPLPNQPPFNAKGMKPNIHT